MQSLTYLFYLNGILKPFIYLAQRPVNHGFYQCQAGHIQANVIGIFPNPRKAFLVTNFRYISNGRIFVYNQKMLPIKYHRLSKQRKGINQKKEDQKLFHFFIS